MTRRHHGHQISSRARALAARLGDRQTARLVVPAELVDPVMQPDERHPVARQHQDVVRDVTLQARQRTQVDAERIALGVHRLHADVGRDAGQNLVGAQQQVPARQYSMTCSGACPPPLSTSKVREPTRSSSPAMRRRKVRGRPEIMRR